MSCSKAQLDDEVEGRPDLQYSTADIDEICCEALANLEDLSHDLPVPNLEPATAAHEGYREELDRLASIASDIQASLAPMQKNKSVSDRRAGTRYHPGDRVRIIGMTSTPFHGALGEVIDEVVWGDGSPNRILVKLDASSHQMFLRPKKITHYQESSLLLADQGARGENNKTGPKEEKQVEDPHEEPPEHMHRCSTPPAAKEEKKMEEKKPADAIKIGDWAFTHSLLKKELNGH